MELSQKVCLIFTALTAFGMGLQTGRNDGMPRWQVFGYLALIILGFIGVCA